MTGLDSEGLQAEATNRQFCAGGESDSCLMSFVGEFDGTAASLPDGWVILHEPDANDEPPAPLCPECDAWWKAEEAKRSTASSPVVPSVGAVPVEVGSALARMLDKYLTTRGHTLSTAHLTGFEQLTAEADYILGEALELRDAIRDLASAAEQPGAVLDHLWLHAEREMADVVLATTTLAGMMPGKPTIESCIAEKTEADRGRG